MVAQASETPVQFEVVPFSKRGVLFKPAAVSSDSGSLAHSFFSTPLLRAINLSIAIFLAALAAAGYWIGWRTLPQTSGSIAAPISARATIARDALGTPHISAVTWQDAIFLQGYATAQDRMWQMDATRRLAAGELAEVLGKGARDSILESDRDARRWRLGRIAAAQARHLTPETRAVLSAYARGINFWMETHRRRLPPEFALLNYDPRPWRLEDCLLVALEMGRRLTSTWREKMNKWHMLEGPEGGDAAKVDFLYPRGEGAEVQPGSNAWAISAARSAAGKPILANDPHLEWSLPDPWYLIHLRAADFDVAGASLPGLPTVIIGHNRRIAWGMTNLGFDVQDLYREQMDLETGRYFFQGRMEQARLERDVIAIKGSAPSPANLWVTRHGPVFLTEEGQAYSMRWALADESTLDFPFLSLNQAGNWEQFNTAMKRFAGPAQNLLYADADGNIGYHASGDLPIRPPHCPSDVPQDGAAGKCEWQGVIPYESLPQVFNPPSGLIVTANQNPFPSGFAWPVDGRFAPRYRTQEIRALLESRKEWKAAAMLTIEKDVYSAFGQFFAGQVVAAWDKRPSPNVRGAIDLLRSWNGQMEIGSAAAMIEALAYDAFRDTVADRASHGRAEAYVTSFMAPEVIEKLLRERPPGWFADYDAVLLKSLDDGLARGRMLEGARISSWDYGRYNRLSIDNPVIGSLPVIGRYFNIGPAPMSGSPTTIKQDSRRLGPSLRMIVDFSNFDASLENITAGESGHPLSRHYRDQWDAYYTGHSFPMEFGRIEARQTLVVVPQ